MKKEEMYDLRELLTEHQGILTSLSECLQEEKEALMKDNMPALVETVEKKAVLVERLEEIEKNRRQKYSHISLQYLDEMSVEEESDDLSEIEEYGETEESDEDNEPVFSDKERLILADELKSQIYGIQHISRRIGEDQETNNLLIRQNKAYSDMMMQTIQDMIKKSGTYGKTGKIEQTAVKAGLDRSV